jgi:hypothetical protein
MKTLWGIPKLLDCYNWSEFSRQAMDLGEFQNELRAVFSRVETHLEVGTIKPGRAIL